MSACIESTDFKRPDGYSHRYHKGASVLSHRLAWMMSRGDIPKGLCVCHKCDNRACINIGHLFLGTHLDNMQDMDAKGRRAAMPSTAKLDWASVREIRSIEGWPHGAIAKLYGVGRTTVQKIIAMETWRE